MTVQRNFPPFWNSELSHADVEETELQRKQQGFFFRLKKQVKRIVSEPSRSVSDALFSVYQHDLILVPLPGRRTRQPSLG